MWREIFIRVNSVYKRVLKYFADRQVGPNDLQHGDQEVDPGAQKVIADFAQIQKEAEMLDEMKEQQEAQAKVDASKRAEDDERQISERRKKRVKLLKSDPKKAEQVERLGMGVGVGAGVSHSVLSEMQEIEQETPTSSSSNKSKNKLSFFDDYDIVETSSDRGSTLLSGLDSFSENSTSFDFDRPTKPKDDVDEFIDARSALSSTSSSATSFEAQKKSSQTMEEFLEEMKIEYAEQIAREENSFELDPFFMWSGSNNE